MSILHCPSHSMNSSWEELNSKRIISALSPVTTAALRKEEGSIPEEVRLSPSYPRHKKAPALFGHGTIWLYTQKRAYIQCMHYLETWPQTSSKFLLAVSQPALFLFFFSQNLDKKVGQIFHRAANCTKRATLPSFIPTLQRWKRFSFHLVCNAWAKQQVLPVTRTDNFTIKILGGKKVLISMLEMQNFNKNI